MNSPSLETELGAASRASEVMSRLKPGDFWIEVVPSYLDATLALSALGMIEGKESGVVALAVLPTRQPYGPLIWEAQDAANKSYNLETMKEAAVLFVARDTVPLLSQARWMHRVRQDVAGERASKAAVVTLLVLVIFLVLFLAVVGGFGIRY